MLRSPLLTVSNQNQRHPLVLPSIGMGTLGGTIRVRKSTPRRKSSLENWCGDDSSRLVRILGAWTMT